MKRLSKVRIAAMVVGALALVGCEYGERVQNAPNAGEVLPVQAFEWHVVSNSQLQAKYMEYGGDLPTDHLVQGFLAVEENTGRRLVYTTAPKRVDDSVACTLGHEVMHIAIGEFHKAKGKQ